MFSLDGLDSDSFNDAINGTSLSVSLSSTMTTSVNPSNVNAQVLVQWKRIYVPYFNDPANIRPIIESDLREFAVHPPTTKKKLLSGIQHNLKGGAMAWALRSNLALATSAEACELVGCLSCESGNLSMLPDCDYIRCLGQRVRVVDELSNAVGNGDCGDSHFTTNVQQFSDSQFNSFV